MENIIGRGSWVCSFQGEDGDEDDEDVDEGVEDGEDDDEDVEQGGLRTGKGGWFKNSF